MRHTACGLCPEGPRRRAASRATRSTFRTASTRTSRLPRSTLRWRAANGGTPPSARGGRYAIRSEKARVRAVPERSATRARTVNVPLRAGTPVTPSGRRQAKAGRQRPADARPVVRRRAPRRLQQHVVAPARVPRRERARGDGEQPAHRGRRGLRCDPELNERAVHEACHRLGPGRGQMDVIGLEPGGLLRDAAFQSTTVSSGWRRAASRIMSFMDA